MTNAHDLAPTDAIRLLIADDETDLVWSLKQRLERERPNWEIFTAHNGAEALKLVRAVPLDCACVDLRMPELSGLDVAMHVRGLYPALPIVLMTAYPTSAGLSTMRANSIVDYLEKPFDFATFLRAIGTAVRTRRVTGFSGDIMMPGLPDIVQLYALGQAAGCLEVTSASGQVGRIWFDRGNVVHAAAGKLVGEDAFYVVMSWKGGKFSMTQGQAAPTQSITVSWTELIMESARRVDEATRGPPQSSNPGSPSEPPTRDETTGWTLSPPSTNDAQTIVPKAPATPQLDTTPEVVTETPKDTQGEHHMANLKETLGKLDSVDGFIGACLCDSDSGMVLASVGGGGMINLDIAGAANTEVVRAKRKAAKALNLKDDIEDILITLGRQYHMIRPLRSKPQVFIYIALDRSRSNLAMARMTLADVEKDIVI